jgi:hypothetical protein
MGFFKIFFIAAALGAVSSFAQPAAPTGSELPCQAAAGTDEVAIAADSGFVKIFDGTSFKGWWHNCQSEDAGPNREAGGIWKVDPAEQAMYSMQRDDGSGSMLVTNKKYDNHEIIMDVWPDFGNDAGIFHRTTDKGRSFQTVVDYLPNNCIGGTWAQEMPFTFYKHPYLFGSNEKTIVSRTSWAYTGNWLDVWDPDTWNQVRVKFYGHPPHHQTWIRKVGAPAWTPVIDLDWPAAQSQKEAATGYLGLQIHFAEGSETRWNGGGKGNWYRNILVRELNEDGTPKAAGIRRADPSRSRHSFSATGSLLSGWLDGDCEITLRDLSGRKLESFRARAGNFSHVLSPGISHGILLVEMRSATSAFTVRVTPL